MSTQSRTYIAIDLKSFYASVECVDRGLNPLTTNLVVADASRTEKTICLAVSPSLKQYGIGGRARLFEVNQKLREVNMMRRYNIPGGKLKGKSISDEELRNHPEMAVDYIAATPRMSYYIEYSTRIYDIYLKYVSPEDIHVYSIDEVFMDVTSYLVSYGISAHDLAMKMIRDVLSETGITATAGIGTNMYLCKVAMDIVAKKKPADNDGVRIAQLDEMTYRRELWSHRPISSFWRVGRGISATLARYGMFTMGDVARCSIENEELLYKLFGVNAELLIDHAWGWEPCTIEMVKSYHPEHNSFSSGQVLQSAYDSQRARIVVQEMADEMALKLVSKHLVTTQVVLTVGYDKENMSNPNLASEYEGNVSVNYYGVKVPHHAHGTANLPLPTSSSQLITNAATRIFDSVVNSNLLIRRLNITVNDVVREGDIKKTPQYEQLDMFTDYEALKKEKQKMQEQLDKERRILEARIEIKRQFGKNAILKGLNFKDGATARERNKQIGGHKA